MFKFEVFQVFLFDMKKLSTSSLLSLLFAMLFVLACDDKPASNGNVTTPPKKDTVVATPDPEPPRRVGAITPKDSILSKLRAYYTDLGNKADVGKYFSPTVSRYYSRENISREKVEQSIKGTYQNFDARTVTIHPASMELTEEDDGWWVVFKGVVAYRKKGENNTTEDNFHNLFRFDQDYLIDQYAAYSAERDPAAILDTRSVDETPAAKAASPDLQSAVIGIISGLAEGDLSKVDSYITPEHGLYLSTRPGAFDAVNHGSNYSELIHFIPFFKEGIKGLGCRLEAASMPVFSCDDINMFSKKGCFMGPVTDYKRISDLMANLNGYEVSDFSVSEIAKARKMEKAASIQVVQTREGLHIILGQNAAGAWKLLVLDFSKYSCGA